MNPRRATSSTLTRPAQAALALAALLLALGCEPAAPPPSPAPAPNVTQAPVIAQESPQAAPQEPAPDLALLAREQDAQEAFKQKDYLRARGMWREVLLQDRVNLLALRGVARSFAAEDRLADAALAYEEALRHHPDDLDVQMELARLYKRMERREDALRAFKALGERAPINPVLLGMYGTELLEQGFHKEAVEVLERALALQPEAVEVAQNLANAYQHIGLRQRAITLYDQILERHPNDADVRFNLGVVQEKEGLYQDALRSWRRALEDRPDHAAAQENLERLQAWLVKNPQ
jgi:tetratricopeptide (TPR) repeat protein